MEEKKEKENNETELIKTIKEEYEKKITELNENHKKELSDLETKKEQEKVELIKAMMSGRDFSTTTETEKEEQEEVSFFDSAVKETLDILKGGNK